MRLRKRPWTWFVVVLGSALAGCSADAEGSADTAGLDTERVYALVGHVWSDDGPTGYVALTTTLDTGKLSLTRAREFPGYTSAAVARGELLVSPGAEDPTIERYRITDELDWLSAGTPLSFLNEGAEQVGFYKQYRRGDREAFVDVDVIGRVVWDPLEFSIRGPAPDVSLPVQRDGLRSRITTKTGSGGRRTPRSSSTARSIASRKKS
jgi:hypothetical protein